MAISIVILETRMDNDSNTGLPVNRGVTIWVSDGVTPYVGERGNLPLVGDLLAILIGIAQQVYDDAVAGGHLATALQNAEADFIQWQLDNPGAKQIFTLSRTALETEINTTVDLVFAAFPVATRTKIKRLWACGALRDRIDVARGQ